MRKLISGGIVLAGLAGLLSCDAIEKKNDEQVRTNPVVEGTVVAESIGVKSTLLQTHSQSYRAYLVKDKETGKYHLGVLEGSATRSLDPFDVGDCAKLTLGNPVLADDQYVNGKRVADTGYKILEFEPCKK